MSVYAVLIGFVLAGQVVADDRYSDPFGNSPAADAEPVYGGNTPPAGFRNPSAAAEESRPNPYAVPPANNSGTRTPEAPSNAARGVSPPPPVNVRNAPTTTAEDYGLGAATQKDTAGLKPAAMMRAMLSAPSSSRLGGEQVRLADIVAGVASRQDQAVRIDAYWDLCSSVADYYLSLREQDELQRLRILVPNVGAAWKQAESELGVRIGTSQRAAAASQHRLASLIGQTDAASLPLPADMPHCGDYYARYEQIFAARHSSEAQQLSELLPLRYEEVKDAAAAVTRAEEWLDAVATRRSSATDETGMLRALELLALRRRAFVQIVRDYNRRIARYAELASPGQIDSDRLIGMLIKREDAPSTATRSATPTPPFNSRSEDSTTTPPQTFVEDWAPVGSGQSATIRRDEAVAPAAAESHKPLRRERSLLVPSR